MRWVRCWQFGSGEGFSFALRGGGKGVRMIEIGFVNVGDVDVEVVGGKRSLGTSKQACLRARKAG